LRENDLDNDFLASALNGLILAGIDRSLMTWKPSIVFHEMIYTEFSLNGNSQHLPQQSSLALS
jgi:hypothetical protein